MIVFATLLPCFRLALLYEWGRVKAYGDVGSSSKRNKIFWLWKRLYLNSQTARSQKTGGTDPRGQRDPFPMSRIPEKSGPDPRGPLGSCYLGDGFRRDILNNLVFKIFNIDIDYTDSFIFYRHRMIKPRDAMHPSSQLLRLKGRMP